MSDPELIKAAIGPVVVEILRRTSTSNGELTEDVIASAFEDAYRGLENGARRIRSEKGRKFHEGMSKL